MSQLPLKLLTYNIHKGIGGIDRRYRLERIADVVSHYHPDIVLLQEVDDGVPRSRGVQQVEELARLLEFEHHLFQPNVRLRHGVYGNAILSRFPFDETVNVDLTISVKKRRGALISRLHVEHQGHRRRIVVANLHLGLAGFERRLQLRRLLQQPVITRTHYDTPLVVGGDFNDMWGVLGKHWMLPAGFKSATGNARTFPAAAPLRSLDAIYYRGDLVLRRGFAGRIGLARQASDHLPLLAELDIRLPS